MESIKQISVAILKAQKEMGNPLKESKNPFFKSSYASLNSVREAVIPSLNEHGISVLQPMVNIDGKNYIKTLLLHESGESLESLTEIIYAKQNDAQAQGSGITYARRYGLQSMVCVGADDDDGNGATRPPKAERQFTRSEAENEIKKCKSTKQLLDVWKLSKDHQADKEFVGMFTDKRIELEEGI